MTMTDNIFYSGELRPGSRPKSRFCHIFVSLSRLNQPTAVKFCTGVKLSRVSRMTIKNFRRFIILISEHAQLNPNIQLKFRTINPLP